MYINKQDKNKLGIFEHYLNLYLADWTSRNYFYYASEYQRDIAHEFINSTLKEANEYYKSLDEEDKQQVKNMLRADRLEFKASKDTPMHAYKFTYIKKI